MTALARAVAAAPAHAAAAGKASVRHLEASTLERRRHQDRAATLKRRLRAGR